jgi:hypothetical protein
VEIRKVLCSTNAIESLNARYRRAVKARGHFPTEQAAMKCLYLVTRSLDPKGTGQTLGDAFELDRSERVEPHLAVAGALRRLLAHHHLSGLCIRRDPSRHVDGPSVDVSVL